MKRLSLWLAWRVADFTMVVEPPNRYVITSKPFHSIRWRLTPQWALRWAYDKIWGSLTK